MAISRQPGQFSEPLSQKSMAHGRVSYMSEVLGPMPNTAHKIYLGQGLDSSNEGG